MKQEKYNPREDSFYINQKLDKEEWEMVEADENNPEFDKFLADRTEQDRKKSIDDFYKKFDLDKANKKSIEFENKELQNYTMFYRANVKARYFQRRQEVLSAHNEAIKLSSDDYYYNRALGKTSKELSI